MYVKSLRSLVAKPMTAGNLDPRVKRAAEIYADLLDQQSSSAGTSIDRSAIIALFCNSHERSPFT